MDRYEDIQLLISAYIDGEVTPEEKRVVEDYLRKNPSAREFVNSQRRISGVIQSIPDQSLSPDIEANIQSRIRRSREGRTMKKEQLFPVLAVCAVVVLAGAFAFNHLMRSDFQLASKPQEKNQSGISQITLTRSGSEALDQPSQIVFKSEASVETGQASARLALAAKPEKKAYTASQSLEHVNYDAVVGSSFSKRAVGSLSEAGGAVQNDQGWYYPSESIIAPPAYPSDFSTEEYQRMDENEFKTAADNPLSTFSIDVDTASYSNIRRYLVSGQMPPVDAVRIEEMINYFDYDYPQPQGEDPFSITTRAAVCPWNAGHQLVQIGLKGKTLDAKSLPPSNLVFLIDVSGSMNSPDKLPLLQKSLGMMVRQLSAQEKVAIVVYAGAAGTVLDPTPGDDKQKILDAINRLTAGGSTAGGQGIELAYRLAKDHFIKGGNNRVILATDGDFNVGVSSTGELTRLIEEKRKEGIFLTVLGFGTGNTKD